MKVHKNKFKILILKCSNKDYWYHNKIGKLFQAEDDGVSMYWVDRTKSKECGGVFKSDAIIVDELMDNIYQTIIDFVKTAEDKGYAQHLAMTRKDLIKAIIEGISSDKEG